jgi:diguanylate cyclase (GGDEF)-like protein
MGGLPMDALHTVVDRLDIGVFVLNRDLEILFWNSFMAAYSGKPATEVIGRKLPDLFPEIPDRWLRKKIETVFLLKNRSFTTWEQRPYLFSFHHNRPVTGGVDFMYQNCTFIPCRNDAGEVEIVAATVQDVTDLAIAHRALSDAKKRLEVQNRFDALTQLFNRNYWEQCLSLEFKRSQRNGARFALIMLDLDHFKVINDTHGHLAGDEVLRVVGQSIKGAMRETDVAGRYGGEEFGVILPDSDLQGACVVAERIRHNIETLSIVHDGVSLPVTASLGVAANTSAADRYETLIGNADEALYNSKHEGRNRYQVFQTTT